MYKERASAIGQIMTNPRSKSEDLSETAKSRIQEKFLEDLFGIKKEFWSKQLDKGVSEEPVSIDLMIRQLGLFGAKKNEESFENDFLTGTPDVIFGDTVYDVKTSWNGNTFPWFDEELPNKAYLYQLQAYMELTGLRKAKLVYCLVDSPDQMVEDEVRRQTWRHGFIDTPDWLQEETEKQMTFRQINEKLRIRIFDIEYNPEIIKSIYERIELCRAYYSKLNTVINNRLNQ